MTGGCICNVFIIPYTYSLILYFLVTHLYTLGKLYLKTQALHHGNKAIPQSCPLCRCLPVFPVSLSITPMYYWALDRPRFSRHFLNILLVTAACFCFCCSLPLRSLLLDPTWKTVHPSRSVSCIPPSLVFAKEMLLELQCAWESALGPV